MKLVIGMALLGLIGASSRAFAADPKPATPWCPPHHHGLLSGLLEGVVHLVDGLL